MTFRVEFLRGIQAALSSWGIPRETLVDFYQRVTDELERPDAPDRLRKTEEDDLPRWAVAVHDFTDPDQRYVFILEIEVAGDVIRILQCDCWLEDKDGTIIRTLRAGEST